MNSTNSLAQRWGYTLSEGNVLYLRATAEGKKLSFAEAEAMTSPVAANMMVVCGLLSYDGITAKGLQYLAELDGAIVEAETVKPVTAAIEPAQTETVTPDDVQKKIIRQVANAPHKVYMSSIMLKLGVVSYDQMIAHDWICADSEGRAYATRYGKEAIGR